MISDEFKRLCSLSFHTQTEIDKLENLKQKIDEMEEFYEKWHYIPEKTKSEYFDFRTQTDIDNAEIVKTLRESNPNMFITLDYNYKEIYHLEFILKNKEQQEELLESIKGEQK